MYMMGTQREKEHDHERSIEELLIKQIGSEEVDITQKFLLKLVVARMFIKHFGNVLGPGLGYIKKIAMSQPFSKKSRIGGKYYASFNKVRLAKYIDPRLIHVINNMIVYCNNNTRSLLIIDNLTLDTSKTDMALNVAPLASIITSYGRSMESRFPMIVDVLASCDSDKCFYASASQEVFFDDLFDSERLLRTSIDYLVLAHIYYSGGKRHVVPRVLFMYYANIGSLARQLGIPLAELRRKKKISLF